MAFSFGIRTSRLGLVLSAALIPLCLSSCVSKDDDDDTGSSTPVETRYAYDTCSIVGTGERLKIYGGESCIPGASAMVKIHFVHNSVPDKDGLCTGTALSQHEILTAAHCFFDKDMSFTSVEDNHYTPAAVRSGVGDNSISDWSLHPYFEEDYNANPNSFDFAIIRTREPLGLATFPLLFSRGARIAEEVLVCGYGHDEGGVLGAFRVGNSIVTDVDDTHIHVEYDGSGANPCTGDSGGSVLLSRGGTFAIAGVTSLGSQVSCGIGDTHHYASVLQPFVMDWLIANLSDATTV